MAFVQVPMKLVGHSQACRAMLYPSLTDMSNASLAVLIGIVPGT